MNRLPTNILRTLALAGISGAALAAAISPAHAQVTKGATSPFPNDAQADNGLTDIVVTAQKRETNLQQTPISISVLDSKALDDRHVLSLVDLGDGSIPGLRIVPFGSRRSALLIGIRGVGTLSDANQPARDQGVGVYLDGVYLGRAQGLGAALYDIERIEVLKGPQGTLFGRNSEGGALSLVTRKPSGEFRMEATAGLGNYGSYEAVTHVDLPRLGNISLKLDALLQKRDGFINNPLAGQPDFNSYDRRGLHLAALWEPSDRFNALLQFDISREATTPDYLQLLAPGSLPRAPIIAIQPDRATEAVVGSPLQDSIGRTHGVSLHLDWKFGDTLTAKSISAYRKLDQSQFDNGAVVQSVFAPNGNFGRYSQANFRQNQFSQELQILGNLPRLSFVGGLFYYHESVDDDAFTTNTLRFNADGTSYTVLPPPITSPTSFDRVSSTKTDSVAVFGQATYTPALLDDRLHLTVGGRYSHDKKEGLLSMVNGALPVVNGVSATVPLDATFDRFDPLVNIAFDVVDRVMVYGKWSTGFRSGGANARSLTYRSFGPESISQFEVGAKTEFFDRRARLNIAAYTGTYNDVQIDFTAVIPGNTRSTLETTNAAGSGRVSGVEVDLSVAPFAGLTLTGSYAYNYVRLPEAPNPFVANNPLVVVYPIQAPRNSASGAIDYRVPIRGAAIIAHLDANYAQAYNTSANDRTKNEASFLVNGRLSLGEIALNDTSATMQVSIWSRNLLNEQYLRTRTFNSSIGLTGIYNEPRTFGGDVTIRF
jgi:iron complex outermembrane receptor protein